ncbi:MFS transporter [Microbispora cellulosiformans]|uniref:MFS transporter n=1 Tax=Microbispora cellulosiformans TaxID=2614688 RepID=A0A5J5K635_9ACTN|nr:MFS transporter [Microbispora cellulosiformans]KAA9380065.1 MFS transporter [Microbispora cellulosiformans]
MSEAVPLRRNMRFQFLWLGSVTSELGSSLTGLALPLLILAVTGSAALAGLAAACRITAGILVSLPAGVWVDRWDRRRILLCGEGARAVAMATLVAAVLADRVTMGHVIAVAVTNGVADAFFRPARDAAIRAVVPASQLMSAYAQDEARGHATVLAGPPLGGFLFGLGRVVPFAVDAVTYAVSMVFVLLARVPRRPANVENSGRTRMRADIAEAARWLWHRPALRAGLAFSLVANLAANALLLPVVVLVGSRGGDPAVTGMVLAGLGLGGLLGAALSAKIGALLPPGRLMLAVVGVFALAVCATTLPFGAYWPAVPLILAMIAAPALNVVLRVLVATLVPDAMMGRLTSLLRVATMGLAPLGPLLGGVLADRAGGVGALLAIGGSLALCCVLAATSATLRGLEGAPEAAMPVEAMPTEAA